MPTKMKVYPNPFKSQVKVYQSGHFTYQLFDSSGIMISGGEGTDQIVIGNDLCKGLFLIKLGNESGNRAMQLVKE